MCLIVKDNKKNPYVAKNDITVYKVLGSGLGSPFMKFYYIPNKLYSIDKMKRDGKAIYDGFHSYKDIESANRFIKCLTCFYSQPGMICKKFKIYKCIIPRSSKYFLGIYNDVVSDKIIIKGKI